MPDLTTIPTIKDTEVLVKKNQKGTSSYWQAHIVSQNERVYIYTSYWSLNVDGSFSNKSFSVPTLIKGKNIGKSNQTSSIEQANKELKSIFNKQLDKGYSSLSNDSNSVFLPMLAKTYIPNKSKLSFPVVVQPKLDGVRAVFKNSKFYSRNNKVLSCVDYFAFSYLINLPKDIILDGELILPPPFSFQDTISCIKKTSSLTPQLIYFIFDIYNSNDPNQTFSSRYELLKELLSSTNQPNISIVPSYIISNTQELEAKHLFLSSQYEGSIIRNPISSYNPGFRSSNILKYKNFIDSEFIIVNAKEGSGSDQGAIIFECSIPNSNLTFSCKPSFSLQYRQQLFSNPISLIGKSLTVKYQGLSTNGVPRFPVGKAIRDYEN